MKAKIISIGNSKGIRIPKTVLKETDINGAVEINIKNGSIVIKPFKSKSIPYNEEYVLSRSAFSDWDKPEEDEAWASLQ